MAVAANARAAAAMVPVVQKALEREARVREEAVWAAAAWVAAAAWPVGVGVAS